MGGLVDRLCHVSGSYARCLYAGSRPSPRCWASCKSAAVAAPVVQAQPCNRHTPAVSVTLPLSQLHHQRCREFGAISFSIANRTAFPHHTEQPGFPLCSAPSHHRFESHFRSVPFLAVCGPTHPRRGTPGHKAAGRPSCQTLGLSVAMNERSRKHSPNFSASVNTRRPCSFVIAGPTCVSPW